ncbi:MAG: DUF4430 domain-containing protein [Candidatus Thorarchaeota archaeon]
MKYRWLLLLIPIFLLVPSTGAVGVRSTDTIIAAEGISVSVDFGNGTILEFDNLSGTTVLNVTSEVLNVQIDWYGPFGYIRGIEGVVGAGQTGWQYWVNGVFASVAVNLYFLNDGDSLEWVYSGPVTQTQEDPTLIPGAAVVSISALGFIAIVYIQTSRRLQ